MKTPEQIRAEKFKSLKQIFLTGQTRPEIQDRKTRFEILNKYAATRHAWITSIPGASEVTIECLPNSSLPGELRAGLVLKFNGRTYDFPARYLTDEGQGERILPHAITEKFVRGPGAELEPFKEGDTGPVIECRTHAGVATVRRYSFQF